MKVLENFQVFYFTSKFFLHLATIKDKKVPYTAVSRKVVQLKSIKAYGTIPVVHCCIVKFTCFQRDGRRGYEHLFARVKRNKMDSELLTCLLKFIEYFPDHLSALSRTLLRLNFLDNLCRNSCM